MAGGGGGRSLEQTPTWAVAVVCFALVAISIVIEFIIHLIGKWLKSKHKNALYEALEKIKSELMLLGFISLLLTVGQDPISNICVSEKIASTWHPCSKQKEAEKYNVAKEAEGHRRRLLTADDGGVRRSLAAVGTDKCAAKGKVAFVSADGIHQLHIFIFVLAIFHVFYCITTLALGRAKMSRWKAWEKETRTAEYQFAHDPERFRFARDTSFGRRHLSFWTKNPVLLWIVCFFRQFVRSVPKVDYLTLRHGFIMAHLAPQSHVKFDFQKYIKRSLEEDFKVVVSISPPIWFLAVLFLLFNTHGWYSYLWLPFIPLLVILLVGTKLQVIITKMGLRIQERGEVVKGVPVVQPGDDLFWFNRPRLLLYLINFVLFQNAFQLAFFAWTWYEFGLKSCFHDHTEDIVIRMTMGVLIQILCSYVTLPLYALVTQMGSSMKPTIFNERVATALKNWHHTAKKHVKEINKHSNTVTPMSSRPTTPSHGMSPVHLLRGNHLRSDMDDSPRRSNYNVDHWDTEGSPSPTRFNQGREGSPSPTRFNQGGDGHQIQISHDHLHHDSELGHEPSSFQVVPLQQTARDQHEINIANQTDDFSFDKRATSL
ncbi:MLO-like protein 6 [Nicotiana tabacum]|uniref:MLO-like protein n=1 Tax=Nicotiana tabacum TaxID=4097 RepID=A0A1S3XVP1_TOBAC|nr:MLO-like protein 6 [Nicotiana tomentosiformis]XP_016443772.1 PREDICTED: MLO-like protein 6 [Nicotiana tabacum]